MALGVAMPDTQSITVGLTEISQHYWMDCHEMLYRHSWSPEDEAYWLDLAARLFTCTPMRLTFPVVSEVSLHMLDGLEWMEDGAGGGKGHHHVLSTLYDHHCSSTFLLQSNPAGQEPAPVNLRPPLGSLSFYFYGLNADDSFFAVSSFQLSF